VPIDDPQAVEAGRTRFGERCAFCHGGQGRGGKGPCLTCGRFKYGGKASQLYAAISGGVPGTLMGAFETSLTREEIPQHHRLHPRAHRRAPPGRRDRVTPERHNRKA
jgi:mono/diheme cytochrome c family protein